MSEDVTIIEIIKGTKNGGARRAGLTAAQKRGEACLVCQGTEELNKGVGWVDGVRVKVHTWHLGEYQLGETVPPEHA